MDFLDPQKQKAHARRLSIGYALIGLALVLATTVLVYWARGFGVDKAGRVIQNGLVFVSSHPAGADISVNAQRYKDRTDTRMVLPAGQYTMAINRSDYRTWKRALTVEGGVVERFDYPFLFPALLATTAVKQYPAAPGFATESPDWHWLLVGAPAANDFDLFDLNADEPQSKPVAVPVDILAAASTTVSWQAVDWAADNRHVLLKRVYQKNGQPGAEYIVLDRQDPTASQNVSILFGFTPTTLEFHGKANDQFYAYDQNSAQLFTVAIKKPTPQLYLSNVLAYASDNDTVLYVTDVEAAVGKALVRIRQKDDQPYTIRQISAGSPYLLAVASYSGDLYAAAGAQSEDRVYVYKDPIGQLRHDPGVALVPEQLLKVPAPNFISFSPNKRFVAAQNAIRFATYDLENEKAYAYQTAAPLDLPGQHAVWMDGYRLSMVGNGKLVVFDFDGANEQVLSPAAPGFDPFFDKKYSHVYTITSQSALTVTALQTPKDL